MQIPRKHLASQGFTLIELLIVVAIIAILAAIAVPNFLEAQTRSKVSRAKSDQRTITTALESYRVDNNRYPPAAASEDGTTNNIVNDEGLGTPVQPRIQRLAWLTTPISYLSSILNDPFAAGVSDPNPVNENFPVFTYWDAPFTDNTKINNTFLGSPDDVYEDMPDVQNQTGQWILFSFGPDQDFEAETGNSVLRVCDPTNGTISNGDVIRAGGSGTIE